jgi:hypothetical protein
MHNTRIKLGIAALALMVCLGCTFSAINIAIARTGPLREEAVSIAPKDAESARVTIGMSAGELRLDGGAEDLLEAVFRYNVDEWEPEVTYTVTDGTGRLIIRQPNTDQISVGRSTRNQWDLRFSKALPLDMRIEGGAGQRELDLAGLNVTDLDVRLGAGNTEINLSDNPTLRRFSLRVGAGETRIDLNGPWDQDADIDIQSGMGETQLLLPRDVGVRIELSRGIGDLTTHNLRREGAAWVNAAYGASDATLEIKIQAGIGTIELTVPD